MWLRGFTLLEVVLVMTLLGILVATAVPQFTSSAPSVDAASKKIRSDIRYAQSLAMSRGTNHGINFVNGSAYELYQGSPGNPVIDPLTRQNFSENLQRFQNTQVTNSYRIEFNSTGSPVLGGGGEVVISNGALTKTIQVVANTGRVVIP